MKILRVPRKTSVNFSRVRTLKPPLTTFGFSPTATDSWKKKKTETDFTAPLMTSFLSLSV